MWKYLIFEGKMIVRESNFDVTINKQHKQIYKHKLRKKSTHLRRMDDFCRGATIEEIQFLIDRYNGYEKNVQKDIYDNFKKGIITEQEKVYQLRYWKCYIEILRDWHTLKDLGFYCAELTDDIINLMLNEGHCPEYMKVDVELICKQIKLRKSTKEDIFKVSIAFSIWDKWNIHYDIDYFADLFDYDKDEFMIVFKDVKKWIYKHYYKC